MTKLEEIKQDSMQARKDKNEVAKNLLITLYSEASMIGKNDGNRITTESEVINTVKKFLKNLEETVSHTKNETVLTALSLERKLLNKYLPKQLTEDELTALIQRVIKAQYLDSMRSMGLIMTFLKEHYDGRYDGKLASGIIRKLLGG